MYHHHLWKENLDMMSDETLLIYSEYVLCHTLLTFPSLSLSLYLILKFFWIFFFQYYYFVYTSPYNQWSKHVEIWDRLFISYINIPILQSYTLEVLKNRFEWNSRYMLVVMYMLSFSLCYNFHSSSYVCTINFCLRWCWVFVA